MSQRKKPQQQLASYFDELLTELEESTPTSATSVRPKAPHEKQAPLESKPVTKAPSQQAAPATVNTQAALAAPTPVANNHQASPKNKIKATPPQTKNIANTTDKNANGEDQKLTSQPSLLSDPLIEKSLIEKPSPQKLSTTKTPQAQKISGQNLSDNNISDNKVTAADSALDLRQREKARLEKLLKSLTPVPSVVAPGPEPKPKQAEKTTAKTVSATENKAAIVPQPPTIKTAPVNEVTAPISALDSTTIDSTTIDSTDINSTDIDLAAIIDTQTDHQWEPVAHEWLDNGRPVWGDTPFDVLLVDLNGIQLAMPLVALDAINPLSNELTPLFGQAEWFMGLQKTITGNVNVINTSQFIMPERYKPEEQVRAKYSVAINGSGWALAVDNIHQPITINPADIRWRKRRSERPWMAGTIKDHVCALIDIPTLANMLKTSDKNRSFT